MCTPPSPIPDYAATNCWTVCERPSRCRNGKRRSRPTTISSCATGPTTRATTASSGPSSRSVRMSVHKPRHRYRNSHHKYRNSYNCGICSAAATLRTTDCSALVLPPMADHATRDEADTSAGEQERPLEQAPPLADEHSCTRTSACAQACVHHSPQRQLKALLDRLYEEKNQQYLSAKV